MGSNDEIEMKSLSHVDSLTSSVFLLLVDHLGRVSSNLVRTVEPRFSFERILGENKGK